MLCCGATAPNLRGHHHAGGSFGGHFPFLSLQGRSREGISTGNYTISPGECEFQTAVIVWSVTRCDLELRAKPLNHLTQVLGSAFLFYPLVHTSEDTPHDPVWNQQKSHGLPQIGVGDKRLLRSRLLSHLKPRKAGGYEIVLVPVIAVAEMGSKS